jgi:cyclohexanecarboxylate-CoA ligase
VTTRRPNEVRLPVPEVVRERWRAAGAWTDETLLDRLAGTADRLGDRELIIDHDVRMTGRELLTGSRRVAAALRAAGIEAGDIVVYQLPNWWESVALAWGILLAGAVASPLTPTLRHAEVAFVIEQTGARLAVVPRAFRGFDHATMLTELAFDGTTWITRHGELDAILADETAAAAQAVDAVATDAALVLWTSGTTSQPKGVVHTHQSLRHEADSLGTAHAFTERDRQLLPMPMTHVAGFTYGVLMPVCLGVPAVLMDVWDPGVALRTVARERISVMISTPVFVRSMIDHPDFAATDTGSVRLLSLGGAGVAPATVREGAASFGGSGENGTMGCWCKRTYGSTEYPTLTTGRFGDDPEVQAVTDGVIIGPAELRIVDPVTLLDVADGQPGELWARGPEMFNGYLDPELDAAAFAPDGWFRTGDLATYAGGYLTIVDRLKDIVIRGGENISAAEVEHALLSHPAVADCAVVAVPDPVMGERTCAFVIARGDEPPSLAELAAHVAAQGLAPFKRPERLELRDTLPRTPSGKVQKGPLRDEVARLVAAERGF